MVTLVSKWRTTGVTEVVRHPQPAVRRPRPPETGCPGSRPSHLSDPQRRLRRQQPRPEHRDPELTEQIGESAGRVGPQRPPWRDGQLVGLPLHRRETDLELTTARALAGESLRDAVSAVPAEGRGDDARLAGIAAWSLAHGFATLLLSHNLNGPVGDQDPEEVFHALTGLLFRST